jgi:hypothetical protein
VEASLPLVCPARFMKTVLENVSDDADHCSDSRRKLIGFPSEW